jgi:phosphoribosylamine-glycine ligase
MGTDLRAAREAAYEAAAHIKLTGSHYRRDIAERAASEQ